MQDTDGDERVEYEVCGLSIRAFDARPVEYKEWKRSNDGR